MTISEAPTAHLSRNSAWQGFWLLVAAITLIAAIGAITHLVRSQGRVVREAYLAEQTSLLIVRYMDANEDRLPLNWDDLESVYHGSAAESEGFTLVEMRKQVEVSFEGLANDHGQENFIRSKATLSDPDPNERVRQRIDRLFVTPVGE